MIERLENFNIYPLKDIYIYIICNNYLTTVTNHQPYWGGTAPLLGGHGPLCPPAGYGPGPDHGPRAQIWAPVQLFLGPLGLKYMR